MADTLSAYSPTLRNKLARVLANDAPQGTLLRTASDALVGPQVGRPKGMALIDLLAPFLSAEEAGRDLATPGRRKEGALSLALSALPGLTALKPASRSLAVVTKEGDRLASKYAGQIRQLPAPRPTLKLPAPEARLQLTHKPRTEADFARDVEEFKAKYAPPEDRSMMLHGSPKKDIEAFDPYGFSDYGLMGQGTYLTNHPEVAMGYSKKGLGRAGPEAERTIYAVKQSVKNPLNMDAAADVEKWKAAAGEFADFHEGMSNEQAYRAVEDALSDEGLSKWEGAETMQGFIQNMGHDGVTHVGGGRVNGGVGPRHNVVIAHEPEQTAIVGRTKVGEQAWVTPEARVPKNVDSDRWTPYAQGGLVVNRGRHG